MVEGLLSDSIPRPDPADSVDVTIEICGSAGDGSIAAGQILNLAVSLVGYHVMNFDSYPAEIRGFGKSVAHTRMTGTKGLTPGFEVDCLVSLNDAHAISSLDTLRDRGVLIFDSTPGDYVEEEESIVGHLEPGMIGYGVPLKEISETATRTGRSRNIVALGALAGIFRIPPEAFREAIRKRFGRKRQEVIDMNVEAFNLGYAFGREDVIKTDPVDFGDRSLAQTREVEIVSGNQAAARACLDAGIRLYAGYPITPATRILEILAREMPRRGGTAVQTEDEISAIGHVIGAGFAGARAATATAGPGLSLMVEFINLAVMAEVPAVVINSQRGGPSTGLPTKTEQSDLNIAIFGGSGDSPRPVLAPANVQESYEIVVKAFEVAEAFQTPVIVLLDFLLSNRMEDIEWDGVDPGRFGGYARVLARKGKDPYRRYALTETGVSPVAIPGTEGLFYTGTGLEHSEEGLPNYTTSNHQAMTAKRQRKLDTLASRWPSPELYGDEGDLDVGVISWGSTTGSAKEAVNVLLKEGMKAGGFFPRLMWPVQADDLCAFAGRCRHLIVAEMNNTGQYAGIVERFVQRDVLRVTRVFAGVFPYMEIVQLARVATGR